MNKIRIIGALLLIIGAVIQFTINNDLGDFICAIAVSSGVLLLITGKTSKQTI